MKSILLALCLFAAPLAAQGEGYSLTEYPDTTVNVVAIDDVVIIGINRMVEEYEQWKKEQASGMGR